MSNYFPVLGSVISLWRLVTPYFENNSIRGVYFYFWSTKKVHVWTLYTLSKLLRCSYVPRRNTPKISSEKLLLCSSGGSTPCSDSAFNFHHWYHCYWLRVCPVLGVSQIQQILGFWTWVSLKVIQESFSKPVRVKCTASHFPQTTGKTEWASKLPMREGMLLWQKNQTEWKTFCKRSITCWSLLPLLFWPQNNTNC